MTSVRDVDTEKLLSKISEELKKKMKMPEWARYVKTGLSKERAPEQDDWWFLRSASILRRIYLNGPVGVSKLRSYYGSRHRRGHKPARFAKASGKIIRTVLIDLENIGFIQKKKDKVVVGREITKEGQRFLDKIVKK